METILSIACFVLILVLWGFCIYIHLKIKRALKEQDVEHKKALLEAGNAITDTLKVAFDNLKKNSAEHNKINAKLNELTGRIHRLEQHQNRTVKDNIKRTSFVEDDYEEEKKNTKNT